MCIQINFLFNMGKYTKLHDQKIKFINFFNVGDTNYIVQE